MNNLELRDFTIGNSEPMTLMGGVNVLESRDLAMEVAEKVMERRSVQLDETEKSILKHVFEETTNQRNF